MITFKRMSVDDPDFSKFYRLYKSAFPECERLPLKYLINDKSDTETMACYDDGVFIGLYSAVRSLDIWNILFIAVDESMRDHGYGSKILSLIKENHRDCRIMLDIEQPVKSASNYQQRLKRKAFYERNGFHDTPVFYKWRRVPYEMLVTGGKLSVNDFDSYWMNLDPERRHGLGDCYDNREIADFLYN